MKLILAGLLLLICSTLSAQYNCYDDIILKNGVAYRSYENKPFTGEAREYYPGDVKVRGNYSNGLKHGYFYYYGYFTPEGYRNIDSIVHFEKGYRQGIKKTYHKFTTDGYLWKEESYVHNSLDGESNYWDESGQLIQTAFYKKGKKLKETNYPFDTSILRVMYIFPGEKFRDTRNSVLSRKSFLDKDSVKIELVLLKIKNYENYDTDTLKAGEAYSIKSFNWWGAMYVDSVFNPDQRYNYDGESAYIPGWVASKLGSGTVPEFGIRDMIIVDKYGKSYELPGRSYLIFDNKVKKRNQQP